MCTHLKVAAALEAELLSALEVVAQKTTDLTTLTKNYDELKEEMHTSMKSWKAEQEALLKNVELSEKQVQWNDSQQEILKQDKNRAREETKKVTAELLQVKNELNDTKLKFQQQVQNKDAVIAELEFLRQGVRDLEECNRKALTEVKRLEGSALSESRTYIINICHLT